MLMNERAVDDSREKGSIRVRGVCVCVLLCSLSLCVKVCVICILPMTVYYVCVLCCVSVIYSQNLSLCAGPNCRLRSRGHVFTSGSGLRLRFKVFTVEEHCMSSLPNSTLQHKLSISQPSTPPALPPSPTLTQAWGDVSSSNEETSHRRPGERTGMLIVLCSRWKKQ